MGGECASDDVTALTTDSKNNFSQSDQYIVFNGSSDDTVFKHKINERIIGMYSGILMLWPDTLFLPLFLSI